MARSALHSLLPDAPQALCDILEAERGPALSSVRSEIFGLQRFAQHGRSLGETHRVAPARFSTVTFSPRLRSNIAMLREAHHYIGLQASTGYDIAPAAVWLLDNFHLIEAQLKEIHEGLPRSYFRSLPMLIDPPLAGLPRIYGVAWAFVAHTDGAFDEELLVHFLASYQEVRELKLSEMWALPTTLRVVLVENLRRLSERVATNKAARELANLCFDRIDHFPESALDQLLELLNKRGVGSMFLGQMCQRLRDRRINGETGHSATLQNWLHNAWPELDLLQVQHSVDQAADNLSVSNAVTSLRAIGDADWPDIIARTSSLMRLMLTSPVFKAEDVATRDHSLHAIERLAKRSGRSELEVAQSLLGLMHAAEGTHTAPSVAGYWLHGSGRPTLALELGLRERQFFSGSIFSRHIAFPLYLLCLLAALSLLTWLLTGYFAFNPSVQLPVWLSLLGTVLILFPASEAVVALINRLISESVRPQHLPRLALSSGIPPEHRVMVVIPAMLTHAASSRHLIHRLEQHYLANPEHHTQFALLSDWVDADSERLASDLVLLEDAKQQIRALNARYPIDADAPGAAPRFLLLHRERLFSESEQRWIGWERKRGKLELLIKALAQGSNSVFLDLGDASRMATDTRYVVTLDSDTQLPPGQLRQLVGVAAHPHNQPRLNADQNAVVGGYGILQPRISTPFPATRDCTLFHWLFAGQIGVDPYSAASSEVYQDVFAEGTFTGKGLLNVQAMHAVLSGRLPEGQILSHDLLEGALARCAMVTDISVLEEAPFHSDVAAARVHRWTRGDWQLLPLLFSAMSQPSGWNIRAVNLWKMVDNLRRSLVAPMSLGLLVLALAGRVISPWMALSLVAIAFSAGALLGAVAGFLPGRDQLAKLHFYQEASISLGRALLGGFWHIALLLQESMLAVDAIARALYRMTVSRRQLLQWTTAEVAQAQAQSGLAAVIRQHWAEPFAALLLLVALLALGTPTPGLAMVLCLVWAASPLWTWWASRSRFASETAELSEGDTAYLEAIARDTWRLFERCVTAEDNHLPPDNLQLSPHDMVAHRTSPSNIGLYLLSVACARQFGWIGTQDLLTRLEATHATLLTLQRHRGHFLNWYDTQTREPLLPMYVSAVDSGNLSAHLLALAQACRELALAPFDDQAERRALSASRQRLAPLLATRHALTPAKRDSLKWCLADHRATLRSAALDQSARTGTHTAQDAPGQQASQRLQALAQDFEQLAWEADFNFLYNLKRRLFHIGYRVAEQQRDAGFYDLLASESRLTSLLAIAKGDVPVRHWAALGRPFYATGTRVGLRSWSGSMFEYLMPSLVLNEPHGSVLRAACDTALYEQIAFAKAHGVPWGISESAYAASDHTLAFQYAPQGVPRLALRRTPVEEMVVAPYATALAVLIAPRRAVTNFAALEALGARGRYGFIEALDFTPSRLTQDAPFVPVDTFMAHHQGMSIVALANALLHFTVQGWGMANAHMEAVTSLLHERVPKEVRLSHTAPADSPPLIQQRRRAPRLLREVLPGGNALEPTHVLSNGHYSVTLRANGSGGSRWGPIGITRQRDDALRDAHGSFFYLHRLNADGQAGPAPPVSTTLHPAPDPNAQYESVFHADRVSFNATWPDLQAVTWVWVSPEDDIEFRQVELRNLSEQALDIELMSAFEVTLADPRADEGHPTFGNLFVRAEWHAPHQALLFERQPRLPSEPHLHLTHFLVEHDPRVRGIRIQTDRQRWLGRNRGADQPQASLDPLPDDLSTARTALDTGLDPVCVLAVHVRIAPHDKIHLTFACAASEQAETLRAMIDKYRQYSHVRRASLMSATLANIRLRALRISAENFAAMQTLTTSLVLSLTRPHLQQERGDAEPTPVCDRRLLWRFGLSGARPLILVTADGIEGLGLLRSLSQLLNLWSWSGVPCDLLVVNAEPASYALVLQPEIVALRERHVSDARAHTNPATTGFYVLRDDDLSAAELSTLNALARVRLHADGRPLRHHVQEWMNLHEKAFEERHLRSVSAVPINGTSAVEVAAPTGEFSTTSGEFSFSVSRQLRPKRPWINVLSNPAFGSQISEAGAGYTWARNSRMNQVTTWSNDPVCDPPSEWFLLQDQKTKAVWSVTPSAWGDASAIYQVTHGQGYSTINHRRGDLEVSATWCVDAQTSVKQITLRLKNRGPRVLNLRVIGIAEWVMGEGRSERSTVHTAVFRQRWPEHKLTALIATQRERSAGFGDGTAFFGVTSPVAVPEDWTCDRRECFDARGRLVLPDHFDQKSGNGLDPCAALSSSIVLAAGQSEQRVFLLGYADTESAATLLAVQAVAVTEALRLEQVRSSWDQLLTATVVKTPDPLFDVMVNRWLLYQTVTCRLWAKAAFYQAGGATGFRDQLQDTMALAWAAPQMLKQQIILCASRQFPQGDVQHWWHAPGGAGVRTYFSDDLLWLAFATQHYLYATGDATLLDERVPFLEGAAIPEGAEDAYYTPSVSAHDASIYEHAALTLDHSLRVGIHGLPLMGSGDWNDGMNRVGIEGRGESVWLGWFLCKLVADFAPIAQARGDTERADRWESAASGWKKALLSEAWDGQWFRRAFFDDGSALGSHLNPQARIDLIAQVWAVLSKAAPLDLQLKAMAAVETHLVDAEAGLIRLLDPPLVDAVPNAGYIQAYPPGVRENGGQYSHAGIWALMAAAELATRQTGQESGTGIDTDTAYRYFTYLSSAHRAKHPTRGAAYGIEPYVMAGDVYSQPPYVGKGGWSWYSGAAAWLHRAAIESIFGLHQGAHELVFQPCLPSHWHQAELQLSREGRTLRFILIRANAPTALAETGVADAQLLRIGQSLNWPDLAPNSCFVIPLLAD